MVVGAADLDAIAHAPDKLEASSYVCCWAKSRRQRPVFPDVGPRGHPLAHGPRAVDASFGWRKGTAWDIGELVDAAQNGGN